MSGVVMRLVTGAKRLVLTKASVERVPGGIWYLYDPSTNSCHEQGALIAHELDDHDAYWAKPPLTNSPNEVFKPQHQPVPSNSLSRIAHFGALAANIIFNVTKTKLFAPEDESLMSEENAERIAATFCRLRGAALKLGQMISIQDEYLPPVLGEALQRARNSADAMPMQQLQKVMAANLGEDWRQQFSRFEDTPIAAASIGQVHEAWLGDVHVAVKVQYPGVAQSIESDLRNLLNLVTFTNLVPRSLFLDVLAREMKHELLAECDYTNEANFYEIFRELLGSQKGFYVPKVFRHVSTRQVLVTEFVHGITLDEVAVLTSQTVRNSIGERLLCLCLEELFIHKIMNTDPNPANFFYDTKTDIINLVDFGAGRNFNDSFVDNYLRVVDAASKQDYEAVLYYSHQLGFLTGEENELMRDAHTQSVFAVGEPFRGPGLFNFGATNVVQDVYKLGPVMMKNRLRPPPPEIYSLHRKLSGCFLFCIKLRSCFNSHKMFQETRNQYRFTTPDTYQPTPV